MTGRGELPSFEEPALDGTIVEALVNAGLGAALPDLTLTTAALETKPACAGMGFITALSLYTVVATLLRARLDAILPGLRPPSTEDMSEYVEPRISPGTKKRWSSNWLFVDDGVVGIGIGGTGGTRRPGDEEAVLLVTPGMYAI
jgi:hypothetical protein